MAIRKFRNNMKPIIWIITVLFLVSLISGYIYSLRSNSNSIRYAFELNGKKIPMYIVQRALAISESNLKKENKEINNDIINTLSFNHYIDKLLLLSIADEMNVKSVENKAKEEIKQMSSKFKTKEEFKEALLARGYTERALRKEFIENFTIEELYKKVASEVTIPESEIKDFYNAVYLSLNKKPFNEVKKELENVLKNKKAQEIVAIKLAEARKNMKLIEVNKEFENYLPKIAFSYNGVNISNIEYNSKLLSVSNFLKNEKLDKIESVTKEEIENTINYLQLLEKNGVTVNNNIPLNFRATLASTNAFEKFAKEANVTETELKETFDKLKKSFDTPKMMDANIAVFEVTPSESDNKEIEKVAQKLLKEVNTTNFADYAKKYSSCPSSSKGGSLGTFKKGVMLKEFEEAVFSGEVGKIYPKIVKTKFGEHIIYIQNRDDKNNMATASHILLTSKPSEATFNSDLKVVTQLIKDLQSGKTTFDKLTTDNQNIKISKNIQGITEYGNIPNFGFNKKITDALFSAKLNEVGYIKNEKSYIIYQPLKETPAKIVSLDEVKAQVEMICKDEKADEKLKEIQQQAESENKKNNK